MMQRRFSLFFLPPRASRAFLKAVKLESPRVGFPVSEKRAVALLYGSMVRPCKIHGRPRRAAGLSNRGSAGDAEAESRGHDICTYCMP